MSTNVVYFTNTSLVDDKVDSLAVILNIEPVTNVKTFAINWKWLIVKSISNHKRDKLLWEVVWSIVIRAS